ncbi:MAG TPA: hypothetical protein VK889_07200 [Solirubrobacterales bacterium]|nr:hypothetical protein [Solirubrobacterales bacterium]
MATPGPSRLPSLARLWALRDHLDRHLFLPAPEPARQRLGRWEAAGLLIVLLALAIVLQLLRVGPADALNSLWAEDGPIYLQGALTQGPWDAITSTYATYLVVVPRLIGEVGAMAPLADAPLAMALASAFVVALCGLAVWHASAAQIRNRYLRGILATLTVLCPVAGLESVDTAAYVPWYMLFASFWVLLWRARTWWGTSLGGLLLLLTGLSTPGVWFFAPLAALRALAARGWRDLTILAGYGLGAAVQIPVLLTNDESAVEPAWSDHIWTDYLQRIVEGAPLGLRLGGEAWVHFSWPLLYGLLLGSLAALALGLRHASPAARWIAVISIPTSVAMFFVSLYQRALGDQMLWPEGMRNATGGRYSIVPALLLISVAFVLLAQAARRRSQPERRYWPAIGAIVMLAVALAASFHEGDSAVRGTPRWDQQLNVAAAACGRDRTPETVIQTSPPGWTMAVPCDRLPPAR